MLRIHKDCGGRVVEDRFFEEEDDLGDPKLICLECGAEILEDSELEDHWLDEP